MQRGVTTLSEILSQPAAWASALTAFQHAASDVRAFWESGDFDQIILTGCGSTYYLSVTGAAQIQRTAGIPARAYPASELMLFSDENFVAGRRTLLICVSRSGTTRETVEAARLFRARGEGKIAAITCHSDSPLAASADLVLPVDHARETSRVQTRSFTSMAVVLTQLAAALSPAPRPAALDRLPDRLQSLIDTRHEEMRALGEDTSISQFAFLGSGALYGFAAEAMLKMTEMSRVFSTAYHTLEFLHGPRYALDEKTLVVGLIGQETFAEESAALEQLRRQGPRFLTLAEHNAQPDLGSWSNTIALESGLPTWAGAVLYLPLLQLLGFYQAIARGYNPDNLAAGPVKTEA